VVSWTIDFLNLGYNFPMMVLQRPGRGYSIVQCVHDTHKPLAYLLIPANASNEHIRLPFGVMGPKSSTTYFVDLNIP
jgi:hypothetical protein